MSGKKEEKEEEEKEPVNLWETFLANAAKRANTHDEATVIVCGDPGCSAPALLHGMNAGGSRKVPEEQLPYFLNYRYVKGDKDVEDALHLHTWTAQNDKDYVQIPTVVPESHIKGGKLGYIICLDASKPSTLQDQFVRWTNFVSKTQELILKNVGDDISQQLKDNLSRRLQFFQTGDSNPDDDLLTEEEQQSLAVDRENPKKNVGAQITLVIMKTDKFVKSFPESQANANQMFELAVLFLRRWSLEYGASLFTFSNRRQAANIKTYVDSVVTGPKSSLEPQVGNVLLSELKEEGFFLPAGFDSDVMLQNSALTKHNKEFAVLFPSRKEKKEQKKREWAPTAEREDQRYLKILRFEVERAKNQRPQPAVPPPKPKPPGGQTKVREFFNNLLDDKMTGKRPSSQKPSSGSTRRPGGGRKDYRNSRSPNQTRSSREASKRQHDAYAALKLINE